MSENTSSGKKAPAAVPTCVECVDRFECGVGNAMLCKGFRPDMGVLFPKCVTCERRPICSTWRECLECGRREVQKGITQTASEPDFRTFALRLAEFLPYEAEYAAVDADAIRLFLGEPVYRAGRWKPSSIGREICSISYGDSMLNGVVDMNPYLEYPGGPVCFQSTLITL